MEDTSYPTSPLHHLLSIVIDNVRVCIDFEMRFDTIMTARRARRN
jgi:hypothetical protein